MIFNIHPDQGDRLSYGVALLLNMTMYMIFISDKLPEKSDKIPFVGTLFVAFFFFLSFGLILSAYTMSCSTRTTPLPAVAHMIANFVTKVMSICCCGTRRRRSKDGSNMHTQHRGEYDLRSQEIPGIGDHHHQNKRYNNENKNIPASRMTKETVLIGNDSADSSDDPIASSSPATNLKNAVAPMMGSSDVPSMIYHHHNINTDTTDPISYRFENWFQFMRFLEKCLTVLFAVMLIIIPLVITSFLDTSNRI